ncbi:CPBP family intramembrane glutamic endopeptidase [Pleionea litopenaei]|uniref:CPBP family intramembrane glutamic endopeptidase n=1 Tax=Pleionea litopenaei TaxID=3070815 RepID=A0AA51RWM1_9GAMM|nr:CPBP family intramembrane glutamic endopeptidase [Pleionea sp. HL-JVS1]WMS88952.1 CPBP family intramembrane glutamic endopeptidase [Pleionea sp. HL-JVS1]
MIGIILLAASWGILKWRQQSIRVLGFNHPLRRLNESVTGVTIAGCFAASQYLLVGHWKDFEWIANPELNVSLVLESLRWNFNSVVYEELIFRGVLLWFLIQAIKENRACLISALCFGGYHWFSYGIWGQWVNMIYVLLLTGGFGFIMAKSFAITRSVFTPIALHFGWNLVTNSLFSNGPIGRQWLVPSETPEIVLTTIQQLIFAIGIPILFIVFCLWVLRWYRQYLSRVDKTPIESK